MTRIIRNPLLSFIEIKQGGMGGHAVRDHAHEELSIGFVKQGSSRISCKVLDVQLETGQAILFPPRTVHLCAPRRADQFNFEVIYIEPGWFYAVFGFDTAAVSPRVVDLKPFHHSVKDLFFDQIQGFDDPLIAEEKTIEFISTLVFDIFGIQPPARSPHKDPAPVADLTAYLDDHFAEPILLDDLAGIYGKSKYVTLRAFKRFVGITPHAYLTNIRINRSKELISQGESVAQTAVACGFFDQSHFIKTFRQYTGLNPAKYK